MILGIDEVGRGPYAGPLVIGACILPDAEKIEEEPEKYHWISELTDSKKLTAKRREALRKGPWQRRQVGSLRMRLMRSDSLKV